MKRRGFNQRQTAEHFGWDETFISQLLADPPRRRRPGLENAIRIERETGIPVEAWLPSALDESAETVGDGRGKRRQDKA
jgi:transcriptional regulator with XRE-family HTH domain